MAVPSATKQDLSREYRKLPAVDALLQEPRVTLLCAEYGRREVTQTARDLLAQARRSIGDGAPAPLPGSWPGLLEQRLAEQATPTLRPVINATGIIVHTNLGRAPLSDGALQALAHAGGYSNLEYDLKVGRRGSRYDHARHLVSALTGADDALIVNNNAAAVFLVLTALCQGRDVLISRGELVEIGGGFRIPDVLRQSGCRLVEVGTTNRTHRHDYAAAVTSQTAAIMRVHSSNFRQIGFVAQPTLAEMAQVAHDDTGVSQTGLLLIDDLGSGTLLDTSTFGLAPEPMVQESLAAGADIVTFSGDKLLGGPQAGLIVGRRELIAEIRRHPMARALRVDKLTLVALDATLRSYQQGRAQEEIPVWRMIAASVDELRSRVEGWQAALPSQLSSRIVDGESAVGGGSLPGETLATVLLAIPSADPDRAASRLRNRSLPVVCRIQHDNLLFDPRTVPAAQDRFLLDTINAELA